jgi:hypothetical protein
LFIASWIEIIEILNLEPSSLYTWAVFKHGQHMETSSGEILQARVGREIQRYKREREEEIRKEGGGGEKSS